VPDHLPNAVCPGDWPRRRLLCRHAGDDKRSGREEDLYLKRVNTPNTNLHRGVMWTPARGLPGRILFNRAAHPGA
jgi:hypothetical protein